MALKKINENPKITDTILLEITTPDTNGCFYDDPYKVDKVVIYYVERNFLGQNYGEYTKIIINEELEAQFKAAEKELCENPSIENAMEVQKLKSEIDSSAQKNIFYYKERKAIEVIGTEGFPAWLSTDEDNASLIRVEEDDDGNPQYGHFTYEWNPQGGIREGDYFVCWTWTPLVAGEKLSAHTPLYISGDPKAVTTIPTHITPEGKYETILERYLPEMYKFTLMDSDITPDVTDKLNLSVAKGFTFVENMANQIIDLLDANALHESLLVYLSNLFNLKLKSSDPTLWRRQIKEAIPLFKKKGCLEGLEEAFSQSGMELNKLTQFWQLVSSNTWTESFKVKTSAVFELAKPSIVMPIDENNFGIWIKRDGETEYEEYTKDYVSFSTSEDGTLRMTWIGDELSVGSVALYEGDYVKILYEYNEITNDPQQQLEYYIRMLPLQDQRDEAEQEFPPKNWNVRLISEEDPLFNILVPVRHPFNDWLIFGYKRTEFGYSENIYNMEEYNGSTRPSYEQCDIDKDFIDPCGACISSSYSIDVGIEELSNDRIVEAQDILREYMPFHAVLHSINFAGEVNEFVLSPEETIECLVTIDHVQFILSGQSNPFFTRIMEGGLTNYTIDREQLTDQLTVLSGKLGTAYNESIHLITPDQRLLDLGIILDNHVLEILSPSMNSGTYVLDELYAHTARVGSGVIEPLDESSFTFNLSNIIYSNSTSSITQDDLFGFSDEDVSFSELGVKSTWDVNNIPNYSGGAWKIKIAAYSVTPYSIENVIGDTIYIDGDSNLPTSDESDVEYILYDDLDNQIATGTTGSLTVKRRGYVNLNDSYIEDIQDLAKANYLVKYNGVEYNITEFDGNNIWIEDYSDGDVAGISISIVKRLIDAGIGYFGYVGLKIRTFSDHEAEFGIVNGETPPLDENDITDDNNFKENYMIKIGEEYYKIVIWDGSLITLSGREQSWGTLSSGGTAVAYSIVHFPTKEVNVQFIVFDHLNRNGKDPIIREIESTVDNNVAMVALSTPSGSGIQENVSQEEGISFTITTSGGDIQEGEL